MTDLKPTAGQLERSLSQKIQALYRTQLGHQPSKITCQLFGQQLAVIVEDSVTQPEKLLAEEGREGLAEKVRVDLEDALKPELQALIEDILEVNVLDLLSDATLETGRTGMVAILSQTPQVRNPDAIPKAKDSSADNQE